MPPILQESPGLLFVVATLLPLASFVALLLTGGLRAWARSWRPDQPDWLEGGRPPGRGAAVVATGAIALSFVLSLTGFVLYHNDYARTHSAEKKHAAAAERPAEVTAAEAEFEARWSGRFNWAWVGTAAEHAYTPPPGTALQIGYRIDSLSALMFVMVSFIATLIHLFSIGYMGDELAPVVEDHQVHTAEGPLRRRGRFARFFMYLSLFCFSMLNLVLADNLFQVFVSWELVGLCSYLLIGHYYERSSASLAANKAFITNRIGDAGFIIGLMILWTFVGTFNFQDLFRQVRGPGALKEGEKIASAVIVRADPVPDRPGVLRVTEAGSGSEVVLYSPQDEKKELKPGAVAETGKGKDHRSMPYWLLTLAGLGIFLGCVGKSAQFPLHVWLPDAMEGPTPVSALIHAATMVAAGVYLVGRVFPLFTPEARLVIAYTGGITLFLAATIACVMTDIKKVLAYSTVSQLGYMMLALGVGGWVAGEFHLMTHAFFKALLFLCSGAVIYGCHHEQDMRKMGGLFSKMPVTALTMLAGVLAIAGTPLFSGWYSKDAILAEAFRFSSEHGKHGLLFFLPLVTAGLTTFYMYRMWFLTFTGETRDEHVREQAHEPPGIMTVPLVILALGSIFVAWGLPPWSAEDSWLAGQIHQSLPGSVHFEVGEPGDVAHLLAGSMALGLMFVGLLAAAAMYWLRQPEPEAEEPVAATALYDFLGHKWYFDELYKAILVQPALVVSGWCKAFDTRVIDGFVDGLAWLGRQASRWDGLFDARIVDGLVNVTADVIYGVGGRLRAVQTGSLRSYVLFLALAAVGIFVVLSYVYISLAVAG
jgi:NADH-quinone oxidoreductase subunit L